MNETTHQVFSFEAELERLPGKIQWTVFYVPFSVKDSYGTNTRFNVKMTIDGNEFRGTLLPSQKGHYMPFNKAMKDATGKWLGDTVSVRLEADYTERTVDMPSDISEALNRSPRLQSAFSKMPAYIQREEISRVTGAKRQETRDKRLTALMDKLEMME